MYHHIQKNIESARNLYETFKCQISADPDISCALERLKKLIQSTQETFSSTGISAVCKKCGESGRHCCRAGTENKCDDILLLINLLLHDTLDYQPVGSIACGFLGAKGCTLIARPVICLNYLCQAIQEKIEHDRLIAVQQTIGRELDLQFILCEKIKAKIEVLRTSHRSSKKK
jgi:hypothetical protein